ncbi:hypothetical protein PDIDSM_5123 [Penicillium digitatum]|nr:hypothetical protein PDIDSM_5123 [Penicillium digitatum]
MPHAGLHRCQFRDEQLSTHDRQLQKRVLRCAYAIKRYLRRALGLPIGAQDSDLDVCLSATRERHSPRGQATQSATCSAVIRRGNEDHHCKQSFLDSYVDSETLTGRELQFFDTDPAQLEGISNFDLNLVDFNQGR